LTGERKRDDSLIIDVEKIFAGKVTGKLSNAAHAHPAYTTTIAKVKVGNDRPVAGNAEMLTSVPECKTISGTELEYTFRSVVIQDHFQIRPLSTRGVLLVNNIASVADYWELKVVVRVWN